MKKVSSFFCIFALCMSMLTAFAVESKTFSDVDPATDLGKAITIMTNAGILNGYQDGSFKPNGKLTRAEFVKIVNLTSGLKLTGGASTDFTDVPASYWAYDQIKIAQKAGYIQGIGGNKFAPAATVSRAEVCVMIGRIQKFENLSGIAIKMTDKVPDWAKSAVENAIACGLFQLAADGKFRATEPITRAEVCMALVQYVTPETPVPPVSSPGSNPIVPPPPDGGPTDAEKAKEAEIAGYIGEMIQTYKGLNQTNTPGDNTVKETVTVLISCMEMALTNRANGAFLTRTYIEETFSKEIETVVAAYKGMTGTQSTDMKMIISMLGSSTTILAVMEYFGVTL